MWLFHSCATATLSRRQPAGRGVTRGSCSIVALAIAAARDAAAPAGWKPALRGPGRPALAQAGRAGAITISADSGYTPGMKTAVSIPDEVFEKVERLAHRVRKSRSEVFSAALREYVARHAPDEVTASIDQVCDRVAADSDSFVRDAARRILEKAEW
jgi:Ribbon-helix-helix protein, copG family